MGRRCSPAGALLPERSRSGPRSARGGRMSVPTPPVSLPQGPGQRRTAPIPPFSGAETPPPLPGVRCRPAAGRGRRSAAGRGGSGSRCPDARNGREHRRSYRRLRSWWCVSASTACGAGSRPAGPISTAGGRVRRQDLGCWGRRPATVTGSCTPPRNRTRCGAAKLKLGCSNVVVFARLFFVIGFRTKFSRRTHHHNSM